MNDDAKRKAESEEEKHILPQDGREGPVDPYTGEVEPPAPDAYKVTEIVPTDPDNREGENFLMDEETCWINSSWTPIPMRSGTRSMIILRMRR